MLPCKPLGAGGSCWSFAHVPESSYDVSHVLTCLRNVFSGICAHKASPKVLLAEDSLLE